MTIVDEAVLDEIRAMPCCWCGAPPPSDPDHLWAKGMGGGGRIDVRINLAPLCRTCHTSRHAGNRPLKCDLLALVAARERKTQLEIEQEIWRLRRTEARPIAGWDR